MIDHRILHIFLRDKNLQDAAKEVKLVGALSQSLCVFTMPLLWKNEKDTYTNAKNKVQQHTARTQIAWQGVPVDFMHFQEGFCMVFFSSFFFFGNINYANLQ